jgi:DNA-binding MarR family transcriptional regulator
VQRHERKSTREQSGLQSLQHRATLEVQAKPYWEKLERGHYLGYYKGVRRASWHARRFAGAGKYLEVKLGSADDIGSGERGTLSYADAVDKAKQWFRTFEKQDVHEAKLYPADEADDNAAPATRLQSSRLNEVREAWAVERPDLSLGYLALFLRLEHAHYLHEQRLMQIARIIGVNIGDMHVLLALRRSGGNYSMRPTDLFRALLVTSGAMTKRIDRLESIGLVRRISADDDRRSELVQLTKEGRARADTAIAVIDKGLSAIVERSRLDEVALRRMDETLQTLVDAMHGFSMPEIKDVEKLP